MRKAGREEGRKKTRQEEPLWFFMGSYLPAFLILSLRTPCRAAMLRVLCDSVVRSVFSSTTPIRTIRPILTPGTTLRFPSFARIVETHFFAAIGPKVR
jgi:hypothetical protein